jgi:hypothetical protein
VGVWVTVADAVPSGVLVGSGALVFRGVGVSVGAIGLAVAVGVDVGVCVMVGVGVGTTGNSNFATKAV